MKTKQRSYSSTNYNTPDHFKQEIISDIISNIKLTNQKLKLNFKQNTVKEELNKIKRNFSPNIKPIDKIKLGEIEYKSNYNNIFNDEIKYDILSQIRNTFNYRIEKIDDKIDLMFKNLEKIKDKLCINEKKSSNEIKQRNLYKQIIADDNKITLTSFSQSENYSKDGNKCNNKFNNFIPSLKLNPHVYFTNKKTMIKNLSKGSLKTNWSDKNMRRLVINKKNIKNINFNYNHNIESMSTDRKTKK